MSPSQLCAQRIDLSTAQLIDLSHNFSSDTIYWPTSPDFQFESLSKGKNSKGYYYEANSLCLAEHGGTHLDAPIHFFQAGESVEKIDLKKLVGSAITVDVSQQAAHNRDYLIKISDFKSWEKQYGKIEEKSIVLIRTGFSQYWPNKKDYLGTAERGPEAVTHLHFPGLHPQAAAWLVKNRKIKAIGIDTASIDFGQSQYFKAHQILAKNQIPIFENLTNLEQVPAKNFTFITLPMKIKGGSGAPIRAIALIPQSP